MVAARPAAPASGPVRATRGAPAPIAAPAVASPGLPPAQPAKTPECVRLCKRDVLCMQGSATTGMFSSNCTSPRCTPPVSTRTHGRHVPQPQRGVRACSSARPRSTAARQSAYTPAASFIAPSAAGSIGSMNLGGSQRMRRACFVCPPVIHTAQPMTQRAYGGPH